VRIHPDLAAASRALAQHLADGFARAVHLRGKASVALSGGTTPRGLYRLLATEHVGRIPWQALHLFWGDERWVPPHDERSNYRMARLALIAQAPVPADQVHRIPTGSARPEEDAELYERDLRAWFGAPRLEPAAGGGLDPLAEGAPPDFDVVLLGLGADGHTASLFPGAPALRERTRWATAVRAPAEPPDRITLTLPVLSAAREAHFLVAGADRAEAVRRSLRGPADQAPLPATGVRPRERLVWWLDAAAAARLAG